MLSPDGAFTAREDADRGCGARPRGPRYFETMATTLRDFAPQILALLAGGLLTSLGLTYLARTTRAQKALVKSSGWVFALACLVLAAGGGGGAFWQIRSILVEQGPQLEEITPPRLLLLGLLFGLPLSLPGVVFVWSDARTQAKAARKKRDFVPSKDDRREFAEDLARQIEEFSAKPRKVSASIGGDGGRVLVLEGEIDAKEVERLTAALRANLAELGFKRVEGKNGTKTWWSRV